MNFPRTQKIKTKICPNCGYDFDSDAAKDNFCPECGQENNNPRAPVFRQIFEYIKSFVSFDNKFWRSLKLLLFSPGTLTKNYIANQRQKYSSPVRMLLIVAAFSVSVSIFVDSSFRTGSLTENNIRDSLSEGQKFDRLNDTVTFAFSEFPLSLIAGDKEIHVKDFRALKYLPEDSTGNWLESNGMKDTWINRLIAGNAKREMKSSMYTAESVAFAGRVNNILIFILLPLSSVIFYMVFYRKGRMYYDILIYTIHSFVVLIVFNIVIFTIANIVNIWNRSTELDNFAFFIIPAFILNLIPAAKKVFDLSLMPVIIRMTAALILLLYISLILQRMLLTYL